MSAIATPGNHHTVTPYLMATDTDKLIDFLKNVFEAEETTRIIRSDGKVSHAELTISGSTVMLGEISNGPIIAPNHKLTIVDAIAAAGVLHIGEVRLRIAYAPADRQP